MGRAEKRDIGWRSWASPVRAPVTHYLDYFWSRTCRLYTSSSPLLAPRRHVEASHSAPAAGAPRRGHQPPVRVQQLGWKRPAGRVSDLHGQPEVPAPGADQGGPERHQGLLRDERWEEAGKETSEEGGRVQWWAPRFRYFQGLTEMFCLQPHSGSSSVVS